MVKEAIDKIKGEMSKNNNPYIQVVGQYLIQHINANPGAAENILKEDKTILKSLDEMRKTAEKKKVGNCAVLTDQEGFEIVLKYFGIEVIVNTVAKVTEEIKANQAPSENEEKHKNDIDFDVRLDDLLS